MIINNILFLRNKLYRKSHNKNLLVEGQFAEMIGVTKGNWSKWQNNRQTPSQTKVLQRICDFFNEKLNIQLMPNTLKLVDLQAEWEEKYLKSSNISNKFKRCPIQPLPGDGVLCQSCQRRIDIKTQYLTAPTNTAGFAVITEKNGAICIPLHRPLKLIDGNKIYPILERTTPDGKPIPNERLTENYIDTDFQETCNLYIDEQA